MSEQAGEETDDVPTVARSRGGNLVTVFVTLDGERRALFLTPNEADALAGDLNLHAGRARRDPPLAISECGVPRGRRG